MVGGGGRLMKWTEYQLRFGSVVTRSNADQTLGTRQFGAYGKGPGGGHTKTQTHSIERTMPMKKITSIRNLVLAVLTSMFVICLVPNAEAQVTRMVITSREVVAA